MLWDSRVFAQQKKIFQVSKATGSLPNDDDDDNGGIEEDIARDLHALSLRPPTPASEDGPEVFY